MASLTQLHALHYFLFYVGLLGYPPTSINNSMWIFIVY